MEIMCNFCKKKGHVESECFKKNNNSTNNSNNHRNSNNNSNNNNNQNPGRNNSQGNTRGQSQPCTVCNKKGHTADICCQMKVADLESTIQTLKKNKSSGDPMDLSKN